MPVIFIAVVDHILFKNHKNVISHHLITDTVTHDVQLKHLEFHYVELPKFKKNVNELKTIVDKWLYFMKEADNIEVIPQSLQNKEFKEAFHVLESSQWNQADLDAYVAEMDELGREERITKGALERGFEEGVERGIEQGIEKGALKKSEVMAIKLLKKGLLITEVADLTDLSIEQIKILQAKL